MIGSRFEFCFPRVSAIAMEELEGRISSAMTIFFVIRRFYFSLSPSTVEREE